MTSQRDERDPALDAAWRAQSHELPPAHLDAAILAAAHRAVGSSPRAATTPEANRPWRWWAPLAAAAAIGAVAIGVLQLLPPEVNPTAGITGDMPASISLSSKQKVDALSVTKNPVATSGTTAASNSAATPDAARKNNPAPAPGTSITNNLDGQAETTAATPHASAADNAQKAELGTPRIVEPQPAGDARSPPNQPSAAAAPSSTATATETPSFTRDRATLGTLASRLDDKRKTLTPGSEADGLRAGSTATSRDELARRPPGQSGADAIEQRSGVEPKEAKTGGAGKADRAGDTASSALPAAPVPFPVAPGSTSAQGSSAGIVTVPPQRSAEPAEPQLRKELPRAAPPPPAVASSPSIPSASTNARSPGLAAPPDGASGSDVARAPAAVPVPFPATRSQAEGTGVGAAPSVPLRESAIDRADAAAKLQGPLRKDTGDVASSRGGAAPSLDVPAEARAPALSRPDARESATTHDQANEPGGAAAASPSMRERAPSRMTVAPASPSLQAKATQTRTAEDWIAQIRGLRRDGKEADAVRELRAFRAAYADADRRLPEDMRAWAATVTR